MRFLIFSLVFFNVVNDVRQNVAVVLLFLYSIFLNIDAIIRVCMLLCETSMLLFVFVCCYAKPRCYYSCSYYVRLNPGLQRAQTLWSGASDKLITGYAYSSRLSVENLCYSQWQRWRGNCHRTFRTTWILIARNQFLIVLKLCITQS